jgi:hypothetical protein
MSPEELNEVNRLEGRPFEDLSFRDQKWLRKRQIQKMQIDIEENHQIIHHPGTDMFAKRGAEAAIRVHKHEIDRAFEELGGIRYNRWKEKDRKAK